MERQVDVQIKATVVKTYTIDIPDTVSDEEAQDYASEQANEIFDITSDDGVDEKYTQDFQTISEVHEKVEG